MAKPEDLRDILLLVEIMMTLSPSTAKLECSFFAMKGTKTHLKSGMHKKTLQMLMRVNDSDVDLKSFDAGPAYQNWLTAKPRRVIRSSLANFPTGTVSHNQSTSSQASLLEEIF